jgi:hypothetical protein
MNDNIKMVDRTANYFVLNIFLILNICLFLFSIYQSGNLLSQMAQTPLIEMMWLSATSGPCIFYTFGIAACVIILILHHLNKLLDKIYPLFGSIIRIILKFMINIVLLYLAAMIGMIGFTKYNVGIENNPLWGSVYIIDFATVGSLLFLVFFVRKP